jgi:hypothetical protein
MYRINQKVKGYFCFRILVAVIVNLVVIPQTRKNPVYYFLHLVLLYVLLVLTGCY